MILLAEVPDSEKGRPRVYTSFYGLTEKPFNIDTDPRFLWLGEKHAEALANLRYGLMEGNGFVVLTGDIGTGKTTLVNALVDTLDDRVHVIRINHPSLESNQFLSLIAKKLDPTVTVSAKSDLLLALDASLRKAHAQGRTVLLIIDEAHRLTIELLEEIRLLSNMAHTGKSLLNTIFVGQNEFKFMLLRPDCRALRERITLFYNIQPLTAEETRQYLQYRLALCGLQQSLFSAPAIHLIHGICRGNPRLTNILCDHALLTGYLKDRRQIDADIILECVKEIDLGARTGAKAGRLAMHRFHAWKEILTIRLPVCKAAMRSTLQGISNRLGRLLRTAPAFWQKLKTAACSANTAISRFIKQHRRRIICSALAVSLASFCLAVTIGAHHAIDNSTDASGSQPQSMDSKSLAQPAAAKSAHSVVRPDAEVHSAAVPAAAPQPVLQTQRQQAPITDANPIPARSEHLSRQMTVEPEDALVATAQAALQLNDYQGVLELLRGHLQNATEAPWPLTRIYAKALVGQAGAFLTTSPEKARDLLLRAVQTSPDDQDAYFMLGRYYTHAKAYPQAIAAYQKVTEIDPKAADAFFNLGYIYASTANLEAAEKAFARVVALKPPYMGKSLFNLAVVQQKLGKTQASIENLQRAVAIAPGNQKVLAYLNRLRPTATAGITEPGK
jgi:type II secretory pathway predicted ATPase ExeA/TPR repeat protein